MYSDQNQEKAGKKGLLSFDLDNTLFDDDALIIPESAILAINEVRDRYYIVLATGRDLTVKKSRYFLDLIKPDAYVHNNGTQVHIEGKRVFHHLLDKELLARIIDFAVENGLAISAIFNETSYCSCPEKLEPLLHILGGGEKLPYGDIQELLKLEVQTLGLAGTKEEAALLANAFPELKVTTVFEDLWYDIMEKGISKLVGMKYVLSHYNLSFEDVIAFGDSMNDLELICAAGTGVAMGNGIEALKQAADYVTDDLTHDGIRNAIHKLCM